MNKEEYPKIYLYKRIVEAKVFIDNNYHRPIVVDDISAKANFSRYHFLRLFKKSYGKTPHKYLTSIRIGKAKEMLDCDKQVSEICYALSFESVSSFIHLFKKSTGMTPVQYAKERRRQRVEIDEKPLSKVPGCFADRYGWNK